MTGSNCRHPACKAGALPAELIVHGGDPSGNRTRDTAVKGRCLNHLTMEPCFFDRFTVFLTSPSWARTSDNTVNSRALYQLSYRGSFLFILSLFSFDYSSDVPSKLHTEPFIKHLPYLLWLKPRPISNSQLHTLPYFHLCPIYLVVFKGSY